MSQDSLQILPDLVIKCLNLVTLISRMSGGSNPADVEIHKNLVLLMVALFSEDLNNNIQINKYTFKSNKL